jgi:release factor glutamine methyltransferase
MIGKAYISSEDSALLRQALGDYRGDSCLEIGAGNGGTLIELTGRFGLVAGTDIVRPQMSDWRRKGASYILAHAASCFRPNAFDLVTFNPPYVPGEVEDRAVDGGKDLEAPKRFLEEALRVVRPGGVIVFLLNSEADVEDFEAISAREGFSLKRVASLRMFYEELVVYAARKRGA